MRYAKLKESDTLMILLSGDKTVELKEHEKVDTERRSGSYCCSSCNWTIMSNIEKTETLAEEVRFRVTYGYSRRSGTCQKVNVVPIAIATLKVPLKRLKDWLKRLDARSNIGLLHEAPLLGTAKIVM